MRAQSVWEGTMAKGHHFDEFEGEKNCDVVIIGGGISGLTSAKLLADAGLSVILLEARSVGLGTSGNSTGNLYVTVDEHMSSIRKKWNDQVMKQVILSRQAAMDLIENNITKLNIECSYLKTSFNYFAEELDKDSEKFIEDEAQALADCGLAAEIKDHPEFAFPVKRILTVTGQAQFHPLNYCLGLALSVSSNCQIYERSQVIDFDDKEGWVKTNKGKIKTKQIIMATHSPKGVYGVHAMMGAYREFGVAAKIGARDFPEGIFWGVNKPKHSIRTFQNGPQKYVMVIGDKFKTGQHHDAFKYINGLKSFLRERLLPGDFTHLWGGQHYRPADGLPYIGKHGHKTWFMTGFATDGLVYGTLAAMIVSDGIMERKNAWSHLYDAGRFKPLKSIGQIMKENTDNLTQYLKDAPWNADARDLENIGKDEAKIVEHAGEKLAAYRDERGELNVVSAVCTHMKCVVNWNQAEKSWDCPCHGSRFDYRGKVLEGPALSDLPVKKFEEIKL